MNNLTEQLENHLSLISDEQFLQEWAEIEDVVKRKKSRTEKQNLASGRNWFKVRLLGACTLDCGTTLTEDELIRMKYVRKLINMMLRDFDKSNNDLGLKKRKIKNRFE